MQGPKDKKESLTDETLERLVYDALRLSGELPATTVEDIERLEAEIGESPRELPTSLRDPIQVLRRGQSSSVTEVIPFPKSTEAAANLARAAREGGEISADTEAKMIRDREAAEGNADDGQ